jgi:hypothetical protein
MMSGFASFLHGHAERHSFYNGWERIDDPVAQTATITKCDRHQVIKLDLGKKTYSIVDTTPHSEGTSMSSKPERTAPRESVPPARPGTMKLDFSRTGSALGSRAIDAIPTMGYASRFAMTASDATGSCRNGQFSVTHTEYVSAYDVPRAYCPLSHEHVAYPTKPTEFVSGPPSGGCKPAITAHNNGPTAPSDRLSLYSLMSMTGRGDSSSSNTGQPGFAFLVERGDVKPLGPSDEGLFEVPPGFTKLQNS